VGKEVQSELALLDILLRQVFRGVIEKSPLKSRQKEGGFVLMKIASRVKVRGAENRRISPSGRVVRGLEERKLVGLSGKETG